MSPVSASDRQLPVGNEIFLDHIAHFVPDVKAATDALSRAGFQITPPSIQRAPDANGAMTLTGTGNVTAMLPRGYIEVLFKTADAPLGRELDEAIARYAGIHLIAFAAADAAREHTRLSRSGFRVRPIAALRRPVATELGDTIAAFTVARVEPGEMREGRIQVLTHHSEDAVWQKRWLGHPNGAQGLVDVVIAVENVAEAAARYQRFLDRRFAATGSKAGARLDRGGIQIMDKAGFERIVGPCPVLPFIGAYAIRVESLSATAAALTDGGIAPMRRGAHLIAPFPSALGEGAWVFVERDGDLPWRRPPS